MMQKPSPSVKTVAMTGAALACLIIITYCKVTMNHIGSGSKPTAGPNASVDRSNSKTTAPKSTPTVDQQVSQLLENAIRQWKANETQTLIETCTAALKLNPSSLLAYALRGMGYKRIHNLANANADFHQAIDLNPNDALSFFGRGAAFFHLKRSDRALEDFQRAIELNEHLDVGFWGEGMVYLAIQPKQAIGKFNSAIHIDPRFVSAYYGRAVGYSLTFSLDEALSNFEAAIEIDPKFIEAYCDRGNLYVSLHKPERALDDYNIAIKFDPKRASTYSDRSTAFQELKQINAAISDCKMALSLDPELAESYAYLGHAYNTLGHPDQAIVECKKAIELNPNLATAYCYVSDAELLRGNAELALWNANKAFDVWNGGKAVDMRSKCAVGYLSIAKARLALRQFDQAIQNCNSALANDANLAGAYYIRGMAYFRSYSNYVVNAGYNTSSREDTRKEIEHSLNLAESDFAKAIELNSNDSSAYNELGNVCVATNKPELAVGNFVKAIEIDQTNQVAVTGKSFAVTDSQKPDTAIELYRVSQPDPDLATAYYLQGLKSVLHHEEQPAIIALTKAIKLNQSSSVSYKLRGNVYAIMSGKDAEKTSDYDRAAEIERTATPSPTSN